jgi:hypothetical protein
MFVVDNYKISSKSDYILYFSFADIIYLLV